MISVYLDGKPFGSDVSRVRSMTDLIELIKATIDPDSIITAIRLDGAELSDADWRTPLAAQDHKALQITTGDRRAYVSERLNIAGSYLSRISGDFSQVAGMYSTGLTEQANRKFAAATEDLLAFIGWYSSILQMESRLQEAEGRFREIIVEIKSVCDQLVQQQMFQSWFILGETVQNKLIPLLDKMAALCRSIS